MPIGQFSEFSSSSSPFAIFIPNATNHTHTVVLNFGVIFDNSNSMKNIAFILLISLTVGLSARGQDNPITVFGLYGCWILERNEDGQRMEKRIYKRCEDSDSKLAILSSQFSLLAFDKAEVQTSSQLLCFATVTENATWTFDETNGIVQIDYMQEWLKEFKEKEPKEYVKFNRLEKLEWIKFKVLELSKNQLVVEKLSTTKPIANRADKR